LVRLAARPLWSWIEVVVVGIFNCRWLGVLIVANHATVATYRSGGDGLFSLS
jgi:hypothetical protein